MSRTFNTVAVGAAAGAILLLCAPAAQAHVEVSPPTASGGSETELTFRAPNEEASARFIKLVIHLPAAQPLASLATRPLPGWSVTVTKAKLDKPITTDGGTTTEYTNSVTWSANAGGVPPGQYQNFDLSVGPLPASGTMTFTADQTYSDGTIVHWNQLSKPGAPEPENPAPVLTLTNAADPETTSGGSDALARGLAIGGLVVGVAGLSVAGLAMRRRRTGT